MKIRKSIISRIVQNKKSIFSRVVQSDDSQKDVNYSRNVISKNCRSYQERYSYKRKFIFL